MSDIAAFSGNGSPASSSSSSRVRFRYFASSALTTLLRSAVGSVPLIDRGRLLRVRDRRRVITQNIESDCGVDGRSDVRVDERHRGLVGKRFTRELVELLSG